MLNPKIVAASTNPPTEPSELNPFQKIAQTVDYVYRWNISPTAYTPGLQSGYYYPNTTWPTLP